MQWITAGITNKESLYYMTFMIFPIIPGSPGKSITSVKTQNPRATLTNNGKKEEKCEYTNCTHTVTKVLYCRASKFATKSISLNGIYQAYVNHCVETRSSEVRSGANFTLIKSNTTFQKKICSDQNWQWH